MNNILQIQTALGSLIDLVPEPKKVKRKTHNIELLYDLHNSDVSSAWAESVYDISQSYDHLVQDEKYHERLELFKDYLQPYEKKVNIGRKLSLDELSEIINEHYEPHTRANLSKLQASTK